MKQSLKVVPGHEKHSSQETLRITGTDDVTFNNISFGSNYNVYNTGGNQNTQNAYMYDLLLTGINWLELGSEHEEVLISAWNYKMQLLINYPGPKFVV